MNRFLRAQWLIPAGAFLAYLALAHAWAASPYVLHQWDTFFDADANKYFEWFTRGRQDLNRVDALHPLMAQLLGWPLRLLTLPLGIVSPDAVLAMRTELALAVSPTAAACALALQLRAMALLQCSPARQWLLGLLSALSLGMLVFGSLPEQFALSGLAASAVLYLLTRDLVGQSVPSRWLLVGGIAAAGVVLSNLLVFALLVLHLEWQRRRRLNEAHPAWPALLKAARYFLLTGAATLVIALTATWAERTVLGSHDRPQLSTGLNGRFLFKKSPWGVGRDVLLLPAQALSPSGLAVLRQRDLPFPDQRPPEALDNPAVLSVATLSGVALLVAGLAAVSLALGAWAWLGVSPSALALLAALWLSYWPILLIYSGGDLFLFSLHVLPPALALAWLAPRPVAWRRVQSASLLALLVVCTLHNATLMQTLLLAAKP